MTTPYGCCNFYGPVSTQLEYDTADYAIAALAKATGDTADYTKLATMAQSWQNVFDTATGYMRARLRQRQLAWRVHPRHAGPASSRAHPRSTRRWCRSTCGR